MYGLELVAQSGSRLKRGTVYVTLGRMQQKGLVAAEPEKFADDSGLVPRRMYRATPYGLRVLHVWTMAARSLAWEAAVMTARRVPVGTKVRAWAERHCDAETLDTLILPAIADLQYEDSRVRGAARGSSAGPSVSAATSGWAKRSVLIW